MAAAVAYAVVLGGHLEGGGIERFSGRVAGHFGYAAEDIRISGLEWQSPPAVLAAIGVSPGGSLMGFEPAEARRRLEDLDWVENARVHRRFPNQLEIGIRERRPFAIWQHQGKLQVIDKHGIILSGISAADVLGLPLVTGEGAESAVAELVNHMEAHPGLSSRLKAAGRVGDRRWNLYFDGPVKVLLPEHGLEKALAVLSDMQDRHRLLDKRIAAIDLRVAGAGVLSPPPVADPATAPVAVAGVSQH